MRDRVTAVQSLGRVPVIPCTVDGALLLRKAMAGDFMPRCILLKVAKKNFAKKKAFSHTCITNPQGNGWGLYAPLYPFKGSHELDAPSY